jgi:hypothetical protein
MPLIRFTVGKTTRYKSIELDGIQSFVIYRGSFSSSDPALNQMWIVVYGNTVNKLLRSGS